MFVNIIHKPQNNIFTFVSLLRVSLKRHAVNYHGDFIAFLVNTMLLL